MVSHLISSKTGIWTRATWLQTPHTSLPCCSSLWFTKELEQEMAIHSSTLAWRIPWTEELGGLQSIGSQRVGHDWATSLSLWPHKKTQNKRQPLTLHSFTLPLFQGGVWTLCDPVDCSLPGSSFFFFSRLFCPWDFPGKSTRVGFHCLLQEIFLTQGLNLGLPHCRQTLYHLSHQGSP